MAAVVFSAEMKLIIACCRTPASPGRAEQIRASAAQPIDWPLVAGLTARHRVAGLVWHGLKAADVAVPIETGRWLRDAAAHVARLSLEQAAEAIRLSRLFASANLPILFVKGITLGMLAYRSVSLKAGWDVDVLVPPDRVVDAAALLVRAGYRCVTPMADCPDAALRAWHRAYKESIWQAGTVVVELHTRLADNARLISTIDAASPARMVTVAGDAHLPTLAADELFAYLCVHGANSGWQRLKWLADVAALLDQAPPGEIERCYRRSQELRAGRTAAQALLLCQTVFGTALPPALAAGLRADAVTVRLHRAALALMTRHGATELRDTRLRGMPLRVHQLFAMPGVAFKFAELRRQLVNEHDRAFGRLPRPLHFLYPLIRLPGWLWRHGRHAASPGR